MSPEAEWTIDYSVHFRGWMINQKKKLELVYKFFFLDQCVDIDECKIFETRIAMKFNERKRCDSVVDIKNLFFFFSLSLKLDVQRWQ